MSHYTGNLFIFSDIDFYSIKTIKKNTSRESIIINDCSKYNTWIDHSSNEWIDYDLIIWGACGLPKLRQIYSEENKVFSVTSIGMDLFDMDSNKVSYIINRNGFNTVCGSQDFIYLGTPYNGIKYLEKTTLSGNIEEPVDLEGNLIDYDYSNNVSSNEIKYIHCNYYNNILSVVTSKGIDVLNNNCGNKFKSTTVNSNIMKCFLTSKNELYYFTHGADIDGIFKMRSVLCDWEVPQVSYLVGHSFLPTNTRINDIFITENTSINGNNNTLFVATNDGAYVVDEESMEFAKYTT